MLPSPAVCEWQSMMPGVTNLPVASITLALASLALTFSPTAAILPSRMRIEPFLMVPCDAVRIVALRIKVSRGAAWAAAELAPRAAFALRPAVCAKALRLIASVNVIAIIALNRFIIPPQLPGLRAAEVEGAERRDRHRAAHTVAFDVRHEERIDRVALYLNAGAEAQLVAGQLGVANFVSPLW